jgi:hypothetical protein
MERPMTTAETRFATPNASKYLQQLCKHWSHKFPVEFTPEHGTIPFADGRVCHLSASADTLAIRVEVPDEATLERMEQVVIDHLKRFAFRENLDGVTWTKLAAA